MYFWRCGDAWFIFYEHSKKQKLRLKTHTTTRPASAGLKLQGALRLEIFGSPGWVKTDELKKCLQFEYLWAPITRGAPGQLVQILYMVIQHCIKNWALGNKASSVDCVENEYFTHAIKRRLTLQRLQCNLCVRAKNRRWKDGPIYEEINENTEVYESISMDRINWSVFASAFTLKSKWHSKISKKYSCNILNGQPIKVSKLMLVFDINSTYLTFFLSFFFKFINFYK